MEIMFDKISAKQKHLGRNGTSKIGALISEVLKKLKAEI